MGIQYLFFTVNSQNDSCVVFLLERDGVAVTDVVGVCVLSGHIREGWAYSAFSSQLAVKMTAVCFCTGGGWCCCD